MTDEPTETTESTPQPAADPVPADSAEACGQCTGRGIVAVATDDVKCAACDGSGRARGAQE